MLNTEDRLDWLVRAVRSVIDVARPSLEKSKTKASRFLADDFIWEALLVSMSTMGNTSGHRLVREEKFHRQVTWPALASLSPAERLLRLDTVLAAATVRMSHKKADWLAANYQLIENENGPAAVKAHLESLSGRDAKITFLRRFDGIGKSTGATS